MRNTTARQNPTPKIVLDANVLIAASISSAGASREILRLASIENPPFRLALSEYILEEVRDNLRKLHQWNALIWFENFIDSLSFELVPNPPRQQVLSNLSLVPQDVNDVPVALTALNCGADILVAHDGHMSDVNQHTEELRRNLEVLKPAQCLARIRGG